jgi:DNA polymerase-3 subunit gamma/tau
VVKLAHEKRGANLNPPKAMREDNPEPPPSVMPDVCAESNNSTTSLEKVKEAWPNVINDITQIKMSVATYLNVGSPLKLENNILTISFPRGHSLNKESLERKDNKAIIEKTVSKLFNANLKVNFILSEEKLEKEDSENNFIKSALNTFKGRVIRGG